MNTLDENIFTACICPYLTGKIIDDILLVNKQYNKVVKADMKHLYNLFWKVEYSEILGHKSKSLFKDGKLEGEQLEWWKNGQLLNKKFCKEGKLASFIRGMNQGVLDEGLFLGESRVPEVVFIDQEVRRIE